MTDTCTCPPDDCHGGHTIQLSDGPPVVCLPASELEALRARVAELEAAQREPVGYVPLITRDDGRSWISGTGPQSRVEARADVDYYLRGGFAARVVELREVTE